MDTVQIIKQLNLPKDDFAVFGSGPICVRGLRECRDIDIIVRPSLFEKARELGTVKPMGDGREMIFIEDGNIEIFSHWRPGAWDIDELIDTADVIDDIRFVTLENVLKWKKSMGREKDIKDIEIINNFLAGNDQS